MNLKYDFIINKFNHFKFTYKHGLKTTHDFHPKKIKIKIFTLI